MKRDLIALAIAFAAFTPGLTHAGVIWAGNGHEYAVIAAEDITWSVARTDALASGWDLATITSAAEDAFVIGLLPTSAELSNYYWLGATDLIAEGVFEWVSGEAFGYTNWYPGEPNNYTGNADGNESYLSYYFYGASPVGARWNDAPNAGYPDHVRGYVVERSMSSAVPEPATLVLVGFGLVGVGMLRRRKSVQ